MNSVVSAAYRPNPIGRAAMRHAATFWFLVALLGQWLFVYYIAMAFGVPVATQNLPAVNEVQMITGYVPGELIGNLFMLSHILLGGVLSFGGLVQLVPAIRARWPSVHRWNGRVFICAALAAATGGLGLTWIRGSRLSDLSALGVSLNGVLILLAAFLAWRFARQRRFDVHRRWAIRTLILVSGVWTFRLALMGWFLLNQGPRGNNETLDGPADIAISFGCYLVPLAIAELYFWAERRPTMSSQLAAATTLTLSTVAMGVGIFAAYVMMWRPLIG